MEITTQHKPGDVVNGHRLSEDGTTWVPVAPPPAPEASEKKNFFMRHKVLTGVAAATGLIVVGGVLAGGEDGETTSAAPDAIEQSVEEAPAEGLPGVGDPVADGDFEFVVNGVESGVANVGGEYGETAQGAYTIVEVTVTNIGDEAQMFFDSNVTATDAQGREFEADSMAGIWVNEDADAFLTEINPGNSVTAKIVFDVPADATLTSVTLHDSAFSGGAEVELS